MLASFLKASLQSRGIARPAIALSISSVSKRAFSKSCTAAWDRANVISEVKRLQSPPLSLCASVARAFSSSAPGGEDVAALEEEAGRKFVYAIRFTVVCVLLGMAIKIFPSLGRNSPDQVLSMMKAEGPIFKKTAIHRTKALAKEEGTAQQLVDKGIATQLVKDLEQTQDKEVEKVGLELMELLFAHDFAREGFLLAGAKSMLEKKSAKEGSNQLMARQLLVAITIQERHVA